MTVEMNKCLDCGTDVEKSGAGGTLQCGLCGVRYSAAVTQRRNEGRLKVTKKGTIKYKGRGTPLPIIVEDLSNCGAKIRYAGDTALFYDRKTQGDSILILDIAELELHTFAKVVWTAPVNIEESRAGLRFFWHS